MWDVGQVETPDGTKKLRIAYPTLIDFRIANPEEREDKRDAPVEWWICF
jgi:hypothetical protein